MGRGKNKPGRSNKNQGKRGNKPGQRPHLSGAEQEKAKRERRRLNLAQLGHVFSATTSTSLMTQAASFASIDEWVHMPLAEREAREESKRNRDQFLNSVLELIDERQRPPEDIKYNKPVLFGVLVFDQLFDIFSNPIDVSEVWELCRRLVKNLGFFGSLAPKLIV